MTAHVSLETVSQDIHLRATALSTGWQRVRCSGPNGQQDRTIPRILLEKMQSSLDRTQATPLHHQVSRALSEGILDGTIEAGSRLPSTRGLANFLGVSRNTVIAAYDLLIAEGLLESLHGSGTFVAEVDVPARKPRQKPLCGTPVPLSHRPDTPKGITVLGRQMSHDGKARTFRPDLPAIDQFPITQWTKMMTRMVNGLAADPQRFLLAECDAQGCLPLREALASQFSRVRGIRCSAENIIIFAGAQQARSIVLQALLRPGDRAIVEDPCHPRAVETLRSSGARVIAVPVDKDGLDVAKALEMSTRARMAYVSPRTQFPLGHRLSNTRRQMLETWAYETSAWIIEDDYSDDSSILQQDQPLPLDSERNRTILLGAFNKIMFPALRFAFAVVPNGILPQLAEARRLAGGYAPLAEQLVLEEFIREGHLDRYIRRSAKLASQRLAFMTGMMKHHLDGLIEPVVTGSNTHIIGLLGEHEEQSVVDEGAALGLELVPLSRFSRVHRLPAGLLLGYGGFQEYEIEVGIEKLRLAVERA